MREEDRIQKDIVDYLNAVLPKSFRVFAVPNAARRTSTGRPANAVPGLRSGVPDLAIHGLGKAFEIEVKSAKGVLSDEQEDWATWACLHGHPHCVARSVDDVRVALKAWNIKTREASQ